MAQTTTEIKFKKKTWTWISEKELQNEFNAIKLFAKISMEL